MASVRITTVGLFAAAVLVSTAAAGCGNDDKDSKESTSSSSSSATTTSSSAASTSAAAAPAAQGAGPDYANLLLKPADVDPSFVASDITRNPNNQPGVGQTLSNPAKGENLLFVILVDDTPAAAVQSLQGFKESLAKEVTAQPEPADVGDGGFIATGMSPDGSKAVTEVYFTEGKALVNVEFESAPADPVKPDTALAIAKMQQAQVKNNLPA